MGVSRHPIKSQWGWERGEASSLCDVWRKAILPDTNNVSLAASALLVALPWWKCEGNPSKIAGWRDVSAMLPPHSPPVHVSIPPSPVGAMCLQLLRGTVRTHHRCSTGLTKAFPAGRYTTRECLGIYETLIAQKVYAGCKELLGNLMFLVFGMDRRT